MVKIGEPIFLSNLLFHPLHGDDQGNGFLVLDEVEGKVGIEELDQAQVDQIMIENKSDRPLVMIDGEEVIGALQNRIVAASTILEPKARSEVLTTCVERNRWEGDQYFASGRTCSFPSVRAMIAEATIRGRSSQEAVWKRIDDKLTSTRTLSKTSSMHDIFENLKSELDRYVVEAKGIDANGLVATCGNEILGLDYFRSRGLFRKFKDKLIRSYGLEAIDRRMPSGQVNVDRFVNKVLNGDGKWKRTKGGGQGRLEALLSRRLVARRLRYKRKLIHISAFPVG